jgi:hypothetical protein
MNTAIERIRRDEPTVADLTQFIEHCGLKRHIVYWFWGWHRPPEGISATPGVYAIFGPSNELLYIGSSGNLKSRLANHEILQRHRGAWVKVRFCHPRSYEWLAIEARLIQRLRPPLNRQLKTVSTCGATEPRA